MTFEKFAFMNNQQVPKFMICAKRKHSNDPFAALYVKIVFNDETHERSMGIRCPYNNWQKEKQLIVDFPKETHDLKKAVAELTQKIMGAYYLLKQEDVDFTLSEILEVSNGDRKPGALSFCQSFNDIIARMEKAMDRDGYSKSNVQKHKRCLVHFQDFMKAYYNSPDISFAKINSSMLYAVLLLIDTLKCQNIFCLRYCYDVIVRYISHF